MMDEEEARQGVNHNSSWAIDKNELEKHLKALGYWKAFRLQVMCSMGMRIGGW